MKDTKYIEDKTASIDFLPTCSACGTRIETRKKPRTIIEFYFEPGTENIETKETEEKEAAKNENNTGEQSER